MGNERELSKLISQCRYYNGEEDAPQTDQNEQMLWFYESVFVREALQGRGFAYIDEYKMSGLEDFNANDGVPMGLKALLFNRYAKGCWSMQSAVEPFKEFYKRYYK